MAAGNAGSHDLVCGENQQVFAYGPTLAEGATFTQAEAGDALLESAPPLDEASAEEARASPSQVSIAPGESAP
jgi:hypothetical protein